MEKRGGDARAEENSPGLRERNRVSGARPPVHCHLPTRDAHREIREREREREASVTFLLRSPPRSSKGKLGGVDNLVPFANSRSHARTTRWWDGNFVGHPHFPSDRPNRECPINVFESRAICSERVSSLWGESLQLETHNFFITRRRKTEDRFYSTRRVMWLSRNEG